MKSLIIKGSIGSQQKSDEVETCQCREGLHALPKIMFDLFLSKRLDHFSAVGSFLWKGMKPFPALGMRHPISPNLDDDICTLVLPDLLVFMRRNMM